MNGEISDEDEVAIIGRFSLVIFGTRAEPCNLHSSPFGIQVCLRLLDTYAHSANAKFTRAHGRNGQT